MLRGVTHPLWARVDEDNAPALHHLFLGGCKVVLGDDRQTSRQPALAVDDDVDCFVLQQSIARSPRGTEAA